MHKRKIYDTQGHAHFVTFSCYKRRRLLDHDHAKQIVINELRVQLEKQNGSCMGFVIMPNHVHAILSFNDINQICKCLQGWKRRSSYRIKQLFKNSLVSYGARISLHDPIWQAGYYDYNLYSDHKTLEKLRYIHNNPVKAGLVKNPCDWLYSSARFYEQGIYVGVPIR